MARKSWILVHVSNTGDNEQVPQYKLSQIPDILCFFPQKLRFNSGLFLCSHCSFKLQGREEEVKTSSEKKHRIWVILHLLTRTKSWCFATGRKAAFCWRRFVTELCFPGNSTSGWVSVSVWACTFLVRSDLFGLIFVSPTEILSPASVVSSMVTGKSGQVEISKETQFVFTFNADRAWSRLSKNYVVGTVAAESKGTFLSLQIWVNWDPRRANFDARQNRVRMNVSAQESTVQVGQDETHGGISSGMGTRCSLQTTFVGDRLCCAPYLARTMSDIYNRG